MKTPSVTEILCGREKADLNTEALVRGRLVHEYLAELLRGNDPLNNDYEILSRSENIKEQFLLFTAQHCDFKQGDKFYVESELTGYFDNLKYTGRPDLYILTKDYTRIVVDFKTGKDAGETYQEQLNAYLNLVMYAHNGYTCHVILALIFEDHFKIVDERSPRLFIDKLKAWYGVNHDKKKRISGGYFKPATLKNNNLKLI